VNILTNQVGDLVVFDDRWLEKNGGADFFKAFHRNGTRVSLPATGMPVNTNGCFLHLVFKNITTETLQIVKSWTFKGPSGQTFDSYVEDTHNIGAGETLDIHSYYMSGGITSTPKDGFKLTEVGQYTWTIDLTVKNNAGVELLNTTYTLQDITVAAGGGGGGGDEDKSFWEKYKWYIIGGAGIAVAGVGALVLVNKVTKPLR
jgi:hypothetical protein